MKKLIHIIRRAALLLHKLLAGNERHARLLGVRVGSGCRIYSTRFGSEPFLIDIGDRVTVTSGVTFLTHDGSTWLLRDGKGRRYRYARISVGSDVFIGVNSIIMPGVRIGSRVVVGAGSVVTKSIPDGVVVAGVPARFIGWFDQFEASGLAALPSDSDLRCLPDLESRAKAALDPSFKAELQTPARP